MPLIEVCSAAPATCRINILKEEYINPIVARCLQLFLANNFFVSALLLLYLLLARSRRDTSIFLLLDTISRPHLSFMGAQGLGKHLAVLMKGWTWGTRGRPLRKKEKCKEEHRWSLNVRPSLLITSCLLAVKIVGVDMSKSVCRRLEATSIVHHSSSSSVVICLLRNMLSVASCGCAGQSFTIWYFGPSSAVTPAAILTHRALHQVLTHRVWSEMTLNFLRREDVTEQSQQVKFK